MNAQVVKSVYAKLTNKPGTLEHASRALADRKINIEGVCLETVGSEGYARFVTPKPKEALDALRHAGVEAHESEVVIASIPNRAGELARATAELAAARVNIESAFAMPDGRLAFRTNDNPLAERILTKM